MHTFLLLSFCFTLLACGSATGEQDSRFRNLDPRQRANVEVRTDGHAGAESGLPEGPLSVFNSANGMPAGAVAVKSDQGPFTAFSKPNAPPSSANGSSSSLSSSSSWSSSMSTSNAPPSTPPSNTPPNTPPPNTLPSNTPPPSTPPPATSTTRSTGNTMSTSSGNSVSSGSNNADSPPGGPPGGSPGGLPGGPLGSTPDNDNSNDNPDSQTTQNSQRTSKNQQTSRSQMSITSMTSTASSSGCTSKGACNDCIVYNAPPDASPNDLDVDDSDGETMKRAVAGRFFMNIEQRAAPPKGGNVVANKQCSVASYTSKPGYMGANDISRNDNPNPAATIKNFYSTGTFWVVPTTTGSCGTPIYTIVDTNDVNGKGYQFGGNAPGPKAANYLTWQGLNVDHVWELSLLDDFFAAQLGSAISCTDLQTLYNGPADPANLGLGTRLNQTFNQLPSWDSPEFAGMDTRVNRMKGSLFKGPGLSGFPTSSTPDQYVNNLRTIAVIMSMMKDPKMQSIFVSTNTRIYKIFQSIDKVLIDSKAMNNPITSAASPGVPLSSTWASVYSTWMNNFLSTQNSAIVSTANALSSTALSLGGNSASSALSDFDTKYTISELTFSFPLQWPAPCTKKRDCGAGGTVNFVPNGAGQPNTATAHTASSAAAQPASVGSTSAPPATTSASPGSTYQLSAQSGGATSTGRSSISPPNAVTDTKEAIFTASPGNNPPPNGPISLVNALPIVTISR